MSISPKTKFEELIASGQYVHDQSQDDALNSLDAIWHELTNPTYKKSKFFWQKKEAPVHNGLYMWGGVGRGKTMLMDLFYECLPSDMPKARWHFHAFMLKVQDFLHHAQSEESGADLDDRLIKCADYFAGTLEVLCFDEMVVRDVADAMLLSRLFGRLMEKNVTLILTSNTAPMDLYEGGWQRERLIPFIKMLQDKLDVVELVGSRDFRVRNVEMKQLYTTPINEKTSQELKDMFFDMIDGREAPSRDLIVKGHKLHVPMSMGRVAYFHFNDLCSKAFAAVDYIEICEKFDVIYIEGIPFMGVTARNEAKRFIALVDALYDTRRRVVMTADKDPRDLYKGMDHAFEFTRTKSRLQEMRTSDYWEKALKAQELSDNHENSTIIEEQEFNKGEQHHGT